MPGSGEAHGSSGVGGCVERLDRASLAERVCAAEEGAGLAADRLRHVLGLQAVGVDALDLDLLRLAASAQLDERVAAVPRVLEQQRSGVPGDLEQVAAVEGQPGVEVTQDIVAVAHGGG